MVRPKFVQGIISSKSIPSKQEGIINICALNGEPHVSLVELGSHWAEARIVGKELEDFSYA